MGQSRIDHPETQTTLVTRHRMKNNKQKDERHGSHQNKTGDMNIVNMQLVRDDDSRSFVEMTST